MSWPLAPRYSASSNVMLYIPGQNDGVGILNLEGYRDDYFVHNLLGVEPPGWKQGPSPTAGKTNSHCKQLLQT